MLAAATNPMDLVFSAPADLTTRGIHVGIFGKLVTAYTPTSGPDNGTPIAAGTIVYLQETGGAYDFALPTPSTNLPLIDLTGSSPFTLTIPPVDITSASVVFNVGATAMALPVDAGGGVSSPTVQTNPNDVFGLFEWVYNLQEIDIDISQVDQAGLPFTAQITPPYSATITQIDVPSGPGQGITVTTSANHNLQIGDTVTISGVPSGGSPDLSFLNGTFVLPVTPPTSTTFTLPLLPAAITPATGTHAVTAGSVGGFQFTAPAQNGIGMFANRDMTFAGYTAFIESLGPSAAAFLETAPQNPLAPFPQNTRITAPFDVVGKLEQPPPTFIGGTGTIPAQVIPGSTGTLGGTYFYKVTAVGPTGGESMASPAQQTNVAASNQKVAVSWNPYPYAIGYHVYRSADGASYDRLTTAPIAAPTVATALKTPFTASGTTLTVTGTAGFPEAGGLLVTDTSTGTSYTVSYTGKTQDTFTGVGGPLPSLTTATIALVPSFIDSGAAGTAATPPANNYLYDPLNQYFDASLQDFFDYYTNNDFVLVSTATSTTWRGRVQQLALAGHDYQVLQLTGDAVGQVGALYAGMTANIYLPFFADNTATPSNPPAPYWLSPKTESPSSQVFGCDGAFSEPDNSSTTAAATDASGLQVQSNTSFPSSGTVTCDWVLEGTGSGTFTYSGTTVVSGQAYLQNVTPLTGGAVPAGATVTLSNATTGYEHISTAPYLIVKDVMNPIATALSRGLTPVKQAGGGFTNVIAPSLWGTNPPWLVANPVTASGGSLAAGTHYYAISAVDVNGIAGETVISPIAQATVAAGQNAMTLLFPTTTAAATATVTASTNTTMLLAGVNGPWAASSPPDEKTVMVGTDAYAYTSLVQLMDVTSVTVNPAERGTGYQVNDILTIAGGLVPSGGAAATVRVTQVGANGAVEAVSIENGGLYFSTGLPPAANNQATGGSGTGVQLNLGGYGNTTSSLMTLPSLAEGTYPSTGTALQIGGPTVGSYKIYRGTSPDSLALIATVTNGATPANSYLDTGAAGTTPPPCRFYAPGSTANFYSAYLHRHDVSTGGLAYGFAYDDQGGFSTNIDLKRTSPSLMAGTDTTTPLVVTITLPAWTQEIRSGDFNGDGLTDTAFRDATGLWTAQLTSSTPAAPPTSVAMATWSASETWRDIVVGNFDGDAEGTDDIAGRDSAGRWQMIAKSGGTPESPTFASTQIGVWSTRQDWRDVVVGDFDANGTDDIAGRAGSGMWWQIHKTGGSFSNNKMGNWSTRVIWTEAVAGNFTGAGRDGIAGRTATGAWYLMSYDTADSQWKNSRMGGWNGRVLWSDAIVGDFDGDGRDDIAARTSTNAWWAFQSDGTRFASTKLGSWGTTQAWSDVQVGDFLGNGFSGIAGRSSSTGNWQVIQKAGSSYASTDFAGGWSTADVWYATCAGRFDPTDTGTHKKTGLMARALAGDWVRSLSSGTTFTTTTPTGYP